MGIASVTSGDGCVVFPLRRKTGFGTLPQYNRALAQTPYLVVCRQSAQLLMHAQFSTTLAQTQEEHLKNQAQLRNLNARLKLCLTTLAPVNEIGSDVFPVGVTRFVADACLSTPDFVPNRNWIAVGDESVPVSLRSPMPACPN